MEWGSSCPTTGNLLPQPGRQSGASEGRTDPRMPGAVPTHGLWRMVTQTPRQLPACARPAFAPLLHALRTIRSRADERADCRPSVGRTHRRLHC